MLEHTFFSQLQESRCRCSFKQFPKRECPGSCSTEGTLVNAYSTFPNIHADIQVLAEVSFERQGLCLDCCYGVFAFQVWQVSQHLATLCFALWVLITCCNWSWGSLNENLPLKYVVVFVVLLFLTSLTLFKALVCSVFAVGPLFRLGAECLLKSLILWPMNPLFLQISCRVRKY